jgi:hypothetical protein
MPALQRFNPPLGVAFDFTPPDLAANAGGRISEGQRRRLEQAFLRNNPPWLLWASAALPTALALLVVLLGILQRRSPLALGSLVFLLGGAAGSLSYSHLRAWFGLRRDLREGRAAQSMGVCELDRASAPYNPVHALKIGGRQFFVSRAALSAFSDGTHYCVYYTPRTGYILSVAPLSPQEGRAFPSI